MREIHHLACNVHESMRSSTYLFDLSRVVEELVYNCLDAGSSKVVVSLSVGSCYVKVEDDGCGITRDSLVILGERHATSKAQLLADTITSTETLGFRGEAISSISDISEVEIRSKARGKPNAYCKIIKSSKCLFFGIDDKRVDVGTTVIVRDLFYNQPIRRNFMQSSLRKVLHHVKKTVFRIALVHPHVSFKVDECDGELKLLCTIPCLSSLSLVTDGFGNEVSSSLQEIVSSGQEFKLSGYISGPANAFLTKALQYIYVNSRFIGKSPIHNLINSLATSFQSSIANSRDNSKIQDRKRRKIHGYPTYLLNLSCPLSSYDLSFEPSKTRVEFKDWGAVLLFFEHSIIPYWKQLAPKLLQGGRSGHEVSCHEKGIQSEDLFSEGTAKNPKLRVTDGNIQFLEGSISSNQISDPLDTFIDEAINYQSHKRIIDDQEDHVSLSKRYHSKDNDIKIVDIFACHEVDSSHSATNCEKLRYWNSKWLDSCSNVDDADQFLLACNSASNKTYFFMENERTNSSCYSTSYVFGETHDFLKETLSDREDSILDANLFNEPLHVNDSVSFKMNPSNDCRQVKMKPWQSIGVIRKCHRSTQLDTPSFNMDPFSHYRAHRNVAEYADVDSSSESALYYKFTPQMHEDLIVDSTLIENHGHIREVYCKSYGIEEKNADFLHAVLSESSEVLPYCIDSTMSNYRYCPSPMENVQYGCISDKFVPKNGSSTFLVNDENGCILPEFSSVKHAITYNSSFVNFSMQSNVDTFESPSKSKKLQNPLRSNVWELRSRRSHSAPPFYKGKKKFRVFSCLPTDCTTMKSTEPGLNFLFEPLCTSQPCLNPVTKLSRPFSSELKFEKSNQSYMIEMQNCEGLGNGSATNELDPASALLTKWRPGILQPTANHDGVKQHDVDILDISSGILHLSGNSLVPASLNKGCFKNAKVLLQLDRKFIPVVASGTLVIIDQHAADERIRLEELRNKVLHGELCSSTPLNPGIELILPEMGYQLLHKYEEQIKKWGWICNIHSQHSESFARSMKLLRSHKCRSTLVAIPHILGTDLMDNDLHEYIEQLVETDGSSTIPPSVIRLLNYKACRGAIMFGDALLPSECALIVEELKATSLCFQCAHGRPTTVPLLNIPALREQLARLDRQMTGSSEGWHGLRRHTPSIRRARQRLESCKRFQQG